MAANVGRKIQPGFERSKTGPDNMLADRFGIQCIGFQSCLPIPVLRFVGHALGIDFDTQAFTQQVWRHQRDANGVFVTLRNEMQVDVAEIPFFAGQ